MAEEKTEVKPTFMFGISRIDSKNTHCWWVRLAHYNNRPQVSKSFSDLRYGGIVQSFTAAVAFRDQGLLAYHPVVSTAFVPELPKEKRWKEKKKWIEKGVTKVIVGTGVEAAKKARALGMSKVTLWKVRSGQQNFVRVDACGGKRLREEMLNNPWRNEVTTEMAEQVRAMIRSRTRRLAEDEITEIVIDTLRSYACADLSDKDEGYLGNLTMAVLKTAERRKFSLPHHRSLDLNGDMERFSDDGNNIKGWGINQSSPNSAEGHSGEHRP